MSISYKPDGSIALRSEDDPAKTETLSLDLPRGRQEAAIIAFFATSRVAETPVETNVS